MSKIKRRAALALAALALATTAPVATAPTAQAGWVCSSGWRCGAVTNASNSKANLLILGDNGVQYVLKPGQKSTTRVKDTNRYFAQAGCMHVDYNLWPYRPIQWHSGGGWHTVIDEDTNVVVYLGLGCPYRGY